MCLMPDTSVPDPVKPSPPPSTNSQALANPYPTSDGRGLSRLRVGNASGKARVDARPDATGLSRLRVGASTPPGTRSIPRTPPRPTSV